MSDAANNFDDSELEDIMREIEELESESGDVKVPEPQVSEEIQSETQGEAVLEESSQESEVQEEDLSHFEEVLEDEKDSMTSNESEMEAIDAELEELNSIAQVSEPVEEDNQAPLEAESEAQFESMVGDVLGESENLEVNKESVEKTDLQKAIDSEVNGAMSQEKQEVKEENIIEFPKHSQEGSSTKMDFSVSGNMNLEMKFDISGKTVNLSVSENGLEIDLHEGGKFSLPLEKKAS